MKGCGKGNGKPVAIGERCGSLTVIARHDQKGPQGQLIWRVRCDCAREFLCRSGNFRQEQHCATCGHDITGDARWKHGDAARITVNGKRRATRLYETWKKMKDRCENPRRSHYKWYGAKGVTVCDEWQSYAAFKEWALSHGYAADLSIDRKDTSLGYSPNNCRWLTKSQNSRLARGLSRRASIWSGVLSLGG